MKIKMRDSHAGVVWPDRPAVHLRNGEVHDVPKKIGERWIALGLAEPFVAPVVTVDHKSDAGDARTVRSRARARRDEDDVNG